MSTHPRSSRDRRAARHLADAIVAGWRADLQHDAPDWVSAVADALAMARAIPQADAWRELVATHRAVAP